MMQINFGKSFSHWYFSFVSDNNMDVYSFNDFRELRKWAAIQGLNLSNIERKDI